VHTEFFFFYTQKLLYTISASSSFLVHSEFAVKQRNNIDSIHNTRLHLHYPHRSVCRMGRINLADDQESHGIHNIQPKRFCCVYLRMSCKLLLIIRNNRRERHRHNITAGYSHMETKIILLIKKKKKTQ